jgi:hypothetical protein
VSATAQRQTALVVLVAGLAALGASVGWVASDTAGSRHVYGPGRGSAYTMVGLSRRPTSWYATGSGKAVRTIAEARTRAQRFADRLGLKAGEVMRFANNFYVLLEDGSGRPQTEVLVDPTGGLVTLEYGPAMMWNTRYGMMRGSASGYGPGMMGGTGGMMGSYGGSPNWTPPAGSVSGQINEARAARLANEWLAREGRSGKVAQPDALPGYYTFHVLEGGKITGMLSVNERTGAVWYHWWHGRFIAMAE